MNKKLFRYGLLFALAVPIATRLSRAQDAQGCKDSPLITRFPGSVITSCSEKPDDVANIPKANKDNKLEGEVQEIDYRYPPNASKAQVVRNVRTALRNAGFNIDWDSGDGGDFTVHKGGTWMYINLHDGRYEETIVKLIDLKQEMVANATDLSNGLATNGHVVANGILFDTGKSDVKPESAPALQEIVKLLQQDNKLKLYVVGHTDNVGALAANMDLSKQRAASVVKVLTTQYSVAANRLAPYGDGPYAPIASNDSEDGRTLNRRVELVKQ